MRVLKQLCGFLRESVLKDMRARFRRELRLRAFRSGAVSQARKVDFIICGTQKGGTTALYAYLSLHPQICMAGKKEVHFFDNDEFFSGNERNYFKYHSWFHPEIHHKILGEATPSYMYFENSLDRIFEYNPQIKLIVILRNPIERAYSHWNMQLSKNKEKLCFFEAIQQEHVRIEGGDPRRRRMFSYVDRGFYMKQLRKIWSLFPKSQVLILKNEDLRENPEEILGQVCAFLGVPGIEGIEHREVHSHAYTLKMGSKERQHLKALYESDIRELERELSWDCSDWLAS